MLVSEECHYSSYKFAAFVGIGEENVWPVQTDDVGQIVPEKLEEAIRTVLLEGAVPLMVVATLGDLVWMAKKLLQVGWFQVQQCGVLLILFVKSPPFARSMKSGFMWMLLGAEGSYFRKNTGSFSLVIDYLSNFNSMLKDVHSNLFLCGG